MWVGRSVGVMLFVGLGVACSAGSPPPTVTLSCCTSAVVSLPGLVPQLRQKCPTASGRVGLDLTASKVHHTFACQTVREPATVVEGQLVALVADRNTAAHRADRIMSLQQSLGVTEFSRTDLVWDLGITSTDYGCDRAGDLKFRRDEIAEAAAVGENATHWLKVEAAYVAGACPQRLDTLFRTVATAGQPQAVGNVRAQLARLTFG